MCYKIGGFTISSAEFKFYNYDLTYDWEQGELLLMVGGNSRDVKMVSVNCRK